MWWDKKPQTIATMRPNATPPAPVTPPLEKPMMENKHAALSSNPSNQKQTLLGPSTVLRGELSGNEDLLVEGQFEGTIKLVDHCLTVGSHGQVKAEIKARQVVVLGSVNGNIAAREKIEIRKTGRVEGDLVSAGIAIEEGAYFKGSIDIQRGEAHGAPLSLAASTALNTSG